MSLQTVFRRIVKACYRCGGTGSVARRGSPIRYGRCPRCGGHGGKTEESRQPQGGSMPLSAKPERGKSPDRAKRLATAGEDWV